MINITYNTPTSGTFTSTLDLFVDIHYGSLTGAVVPGGSALELTLTNSGDSWGNIAPPGAVLINGVDNKLNGTDTTNDFWPGIPLRESHPGGGGQHVVDPAGSIPEPSALVTGSMALVIGLACAGWRRLRAA